MTSNAEVDPTIDRRLVWFSEPLRSRTCLLGSGEEGRDPSDRADGHAGCAPRANIEISFRPSGFLFHKKLEFTAHSPREVRGSFEAQRAPRGYVFWRIGERPILQKPHGLVIELPETWWKFDFSRVVPGTNQIPPSLRSQRLCGETCLFMFSTPPKPPCCPC